MKLLKSVFVIAAVIFNCPAHSEESKYRHATESDLAGYWSVMLLKRFEADKAVTNKQMFGTDPCNVHVIKNGGTYINISAQVGDPENLGKLTCATKIEQVDRGLLPFSAMPTAWSTWQAAGNGAPGVFFTKAPSDSRYLTWQVGYVKEDIEDATTTMNYGFELRKGDLVFNLLQQVGARDQSGRSEFRIGWHMVLRRIGG